VILKRTTSRLDRIADVCGGARLYDADAGDYERLFRECGAIDAVVHTATLYGRGGESAGQVVAANLAFPLRLLEAAVEHGVPFFINTGTALERSLNAYALSKKQFVEWGRQLAEEGRICFVDLELEHFYGPGDDESKFITHLVKSCLRGTPTLALTEGLQRRDFVFVDDVVAAYLLILDRLAEGMPQFSTFAVGSGAAVAIREVAEKIRELSGLPTVLDFGAIPYRRQEVMYSCADISAMQGLGWSPLVGLEEGLTRTVGAERTEMERVKR
jgi:nucleoside-diphosphate-sugar epimerase